MRKRLRVKFAILYALFALLSFLTVSTFGMSLARKYVTKSVADGLYQDASRIASGSLIQSYMKSLSSRGGSLSFSFFRGSLPEFHHLADGHLRKYPDRHLPAF